MSEAPGSTIGYERRGNEMLAIHDPSQFVEAATGDLAPKPPNFRRIVALNSGPLIAAAAPLPPLPARDGRPTVLQEGATLSTVAHPPTGCEPTYPGH